MWINQEGKDGYEGIDIEYVKLTEIIDNQAKEIERLRERIAEQAVAIKRLREAATYYSSKYPSDSTIANLAIVFTLEAQHKAQSDDKP